jgi:hypothetical protein
MRRIDSLLYLAPIFLTLSACSGGTKPALKQSPTPSPEVTQNKQSPTPTPDNAPKIGVIREWKFDGCILALRLPEDYESNSNKYIFYGEDSTDEAQMNIDGRDVDLKLVSSDVGKRKWKVGDRFSETYAGKNLKARIDYVVTEPCDPVAVEEGCETSKCNATITVDRNGAERQVKTIGSCRC